MLLWSAIRLERTNIHSPILFRPLILGGKKVQEFKVPAHSFFEFVNLQKKLISALQLHLKTIECELKKEISSD